MKKLISIVLAMFMLASLVPTFAFATEAEPQTDNSITLFDFGDTATFAAANYSKKAAAPSAFCYDGKESSLRWEMDITSSAEGLVSNAPELDMKYSEEDLSAYSDAATINVRFYSENAGSKFNLVYFGSEGIGWKDTNDDGESDMLVSYNEAVTIDGGWQVHSMSLKTLIERFRNYADDKLITVRFNDDGWSNLKNGGYNDGDTVYIDEIWVDTNPDAYYEKLVEDENNKLIWKSEDGTSVKASETAVSVKVSTDKERSLYTEFLSKETQELILNTDNYLNSDGYLFDCSASSDYKYLNAWIHSDYAQDAGVIFTLQTGASAYARYGIKHINWKGWKLISIDLSDVKGTRGQATAMKIEINKRKTDKLANLLETDHNGDGNNDIIFGLDAVWVSPTSAQAEWEAQHSVGNEQKISSADSDIFAVDFNNADAIINSSVTHNKTTTKSLNADLNRDNSRIYDVNARLSFNSLSFSDINGMTVPENTSANYMRNDIRGFVNDSKMAMLQIKEATKTESEYVTVSDYENAYVNAWIYNPEPKYTFDGTTPADFVISLGTMGTSDHSYVYVAVPMDWSGWKLVSIPFSKWYSKETSLSHIFIAANFGRLPLADGGEGKYLPKIVSSKIRKLNDSTPQNVFAMESECTVDNNVVTAVSTDNAYKYTNTYNYIDVERFWISDGPVTDEFDVDSTVSSESICPEAQTGNISLFTDSASIAKIDVNTVKSTADGASVASASLANGALTLADGLDYGTKYSVCAEFIGTNGVKTVKEFTFNTENYHVKNTQTVNGISVEMYGNVPEDYAKGIMVAAVYEDNTMVSCTPAYVENNKVSVQIDDFDSATQTIKFIFINGWSEIKPLKAEIIG